MSNLEKTVQDLLADITRGYIVDHIPSSYFQRGILTDCIPLVISDFRVVSNLMKNILNISTFQTESLDHLKIHTGFSNRTSCHLIIDSINHSLIYSLVSLDPIESQFEETLYNLLQPVSKTVKKLEF